MTNAAQTARRAGNSTALEALTRAGLVGYGVLHLAVAWLAVQIAAGHPTTEGDQSGALRVIASQPFGRFLVWAIAVGLAAMALWQLTEAIAGHLDEHGRRRAGERVISAARVVAYGGLAWTAVKVVTGAPASNADQQKDVTAGVLGYPGGTWLVGLAGIVVAAVGAVIVWYGCTKGFEKHLADNHAKRPVRRAVTLTGLIGYAMKGVAYVVVGVLLVIAAASYDPGKSTGLDGALRTLATQPFGVVLLVGLALGFAVFGVFCFFQSRYRKV